MGLIQKEITKIGIIKNLNDMQGPCDSGFHVPTADERETLYNVGQTLGIWSSSNGTNIKNYLKMPYAGRRFTNDSVNNQGSAGYYWSCIAYYNSGASTYYGYDMSFGNTYVYYKDTNYGAKSIGMSIRPFKDTPVVPDSSWTVVYQGTGDAGVFHNTTLGLISISSDGTTWITIADKNLGATTVYNNGDTLSEANCGKYYQRGNNYGFVWTGATTTSSTQVNASTYGPGNYYNSNTFITANPRDSSNNANLRGGVSQGTSLGEVPIKTVSIFKQASDMRGPCPNGFHIPTSTEFNTLNSIGETLGAWTSSGGNNMKSYLKLPNSGRLNVVGTSFQQGGIVLLQTSINYDSKDAYCFNINGNTIRGVQTISKNNGLPIRPIKDTPIVPDSTWSTIYQGTGTAGIYHNSTLGLISLSSDGTTWITIADKNLGATTVYNDGDTLSESNCGKYYQRGNNYGFPFTGATTTSSTKVNASTYGPGNYYNSSTFIADNMGNGWDSSNNSNLRGGTTQGTHLQEEIIFPTTPTYQAIEDVIITGYTTTYSNTSYYYGICFTPKVNCTLDKIKFQYGNTYGTIKICQGSSLSSTTGQVTYTKENGSGIEFTLPTPYQMTAGTYYCVGLTGYYQSYYQGNPPITNLTNITYNGGTHSTASSWQNYIYNISSLTTTQTS